MSNTKVTDEQELEVPIIPGVEIRKVKDGERTFPIAFDTSSSLTPDNYVNKVQPGQSTETKRSRFPEGEAPLVTAERDYHSYIVDQFELMGYEDLDPTVPSVDVSPMFPEHIIAKYNLNARKYTPQEIFFVEFYSATLSVHQSAKRLGITAGHARALSTDPQVKNLISARLRFTMMDVEELLARVVRIARFDLGSYLEVDAESENRRNGDSSVSVDWSSMIESGDTYALRKLTRNKYGLNAEPYDKLKALELVAKVLQLFKPPDTTHNVNVTHTHQQQLRVDELKELSDDELSALANNLALANRAASSSGVGDMEAQPENREVIPARVDDVTPSPVSAG